jgi:hypothetical protein
MKGDCDHELMIRPKNIVRALSLFIPLKLPCCLLFYSLTNPFLPVVSAGREHLGEDSHSLEHQ